MSRPRNATDQVGPDRTHPGRRALGDDPASPGRPASTGDGLLAAVRAWDRIDEAGFRFLVTALEAGQAPDWEGFCDAATSAAVGTRSDDGASLAILEPVRVPLSERDRPLVPALRRLLDHWLTGRDPAVSVAALRWAVALQDWDAIDARWLFRLQHVHLGTDPEVADLLGSLPIEARRANPLLTWAWGAARSLAAPKGSSQAQAVNRLLGDAVGIHAQWRNAASVDSAVAAGTVWMLAQRFLPSSPPSAALDAAWETHQELSDYIVRQRRLQHPPSAAIEATFRAASARIALARGDLRHVLVEAEFARALDAEIGGPMVRGGARVALELLGLDSEPTEQTLGEPGHGIGIAFQDALSERLAEGLARLRRLDRPGLQEVMAGLADLPLGSPGWTGVVLLSQLAGVLWGDPETTLTRTDAVAARHAAVWQEQRSPLGQTLLARGRVALLNRIGSYRAAHEVARVLPTKVRRVADAQTSLWEGEFERAAQVATDGLHDPETSLADRAVLLAVRAGALALNPLIPAAARASAARSAVDACLDQGQWIALAVVSPEARAKILELGLPDEARPGAAELRRRSAGLAPDVRRPAKVALSRREQVLLPLLATRQTVPEIAAALQVSPNTVRNQVATLRGKFGAASRRELVHLAQEAGLL